MKLSTKIILPIILISALLILLNGCFGVPDDESPGYTPGTITGIIAAPCCFTSAEPVSETCCVSPEYWCFYCQKTWSLQDGIEVVLTYGEDEVATTTTNEVGEYVFTDVPPGKNYVITAYCPDYDDNRSLVKDVALEVASTFDAKITDLVSTSLGLVVDFLVYYTEWGPEDISLDAVIANKPNFYGFPKFKKLILEVRRVLEIENCGNVDTDEDVQDTLCRAAEEISGLEIGCGPGYTPPPPPPPTPDPCAGNAAPSINSVLLDGTAVSIGETVHVVVGTSYIITVNASDDGIKDALTYSASVGGTSYGPFSSNQITVTPDTVGTYSVYVSANDGCATTSWGPVTVIIDCCPLEPILDIDIQVKRSSLPTLCLDDCAVINSVTVNYTDGTPSLTITDLNDSSLFWNWDASKVSFNQSTGLVCLVDGLTGTPGTYTISVIYTDLCESTASGSVDITFEDCTCIPPTADAGGPYSDEVCPGEDSTITFAGSGSGTGTLVYDWDFGDGTTALDAGPTPSHTYEYPFVSPYPDPYTVTLTVTDDCDSTTATTTVTINTAPVANLSMEAVYHCGDPDKLFWYENCGSEHDCECEWVWVCKNKDYLEKCCDWEEICTRWHKRDWVTVNVKVSGDELANAKIVLNYDDTKLKLWDPDSSEAEGGQGQIDPSPALNVISGTFTSYSDSSGVLTINGVDCAGTGTRTVLSIIFMKTGDRSWDPVPSGGNDWSGSALISFADAEMILESSSGGLICLDGSTGVEIVGDGSVITECPYSCD